MDIKWRAVIRDVLIIFALTFLGGFVAGFATALAGSAIEFNIMAIAVSNVIFMVVGFTISGALAKENRFKHLLHVAIGVWLSSLINVAFFGTTLANWVFSIAFVIIAMGIGGALSFLFVRSPGKMGTDYVPEHNSSIEQ